MRPALRLRHMVAAFAAVSLTAVAGAAGQPLAKSTLRVTSATNGVVASANGRIDCPERCSASYPRGAVVTLKATPNRFFAFTRWTGGCVGTAPKCVVAVDRSLTVRAAFARKTASLILSVGGPGMIVSTPPGISCGRDESDCSASFPAGTAVTLTPTGLSGGVFVGWVKGCSAAGLDACTRAVDGIAEVLAAFRHDEPDTGDQQLSVMSENGQVTSSPPGIDCPPTCDARFASPTLVTLRGASKWSGACVGAASSCAFVLDRTDGVGAQSRQPPRPEFGVNVSVSGPGIVSATGVIRCGGATGTLFDCEGVYPSGRTIVLQANPARRGRFARWSGFCAGKKRTCTLRVTAPKVVQAVFRRRR